MPADFATTGQVVAMILITALVTGVGWSMRSDGELAWIAIVLRLISIGFILLTLFLALDLGRHYNSERIRERNFAVVAGQVRLADALKGLTQSSQEYVMAHGISLEIIPGDAPQVYVRMGAGVIPLLFVQDYLQASVPTFPELYPIRDVAERLPEWKGARRFAEMFTRACMDAGFIDRASGPHAARLVTDIERVAAWFGVGL